HPAARARAWRAQRPLPDLQSGEPDRAPALAAPHDGPRARRRRARRVRAPRVTLPGAMELDVFFAGTAGSVPSARRGLPALLVRRGGDRLLFDCGEGTQRQLLRSVGLADLDDIFLTHHHADHWLGIPGMLKSFALRDRDAPLHLYGPPGTSELMSVMRRVY